jgi:hypothetical protein
MNIIKKITEIKDVWLVNKHDNNHIPKKTMLKVDYENAESQLLDTNNNRTLRGDYWQLENMKSTKEKVIFYDDFDEKELLK